VALDHLLHSTSAWRIYGDNFVLSSLDIASSTVATHVSLRVFSSRQYAVTPLLIVPAAINVVGSFARIAYVLLLVWDYPLNVAWLVELYTVLATAMSLTGPPSSQPRLTPTATAGWPPLKSVCVAVMLKMMAAFVSFAAVSTFS
jgi:hypothetical protein